MIVMKFGGSSVADADRMREAAALVKAALPRSPLVVLSATARTTDQLFEAAGRAEAGNLPGALALHGELMARHGALARDLMPGGTPPELAEALAILGGELDLLLRGVALLKELSPRSMDAIASIGERLSTRILAAFLGAAWVDARDVMRTDGTFGCARPLTAEVEALAVSHLAPRLRPGSTVVTQGYIGATAQGLTTTLGRGGSDFSAALFGAALGAEDIQIWTDVEGVLTSDPRVVPGAQPITELGFAEAAELAAFGAKVLHADALAPVSRAGFRLVVANTHRPQGGRTEIRSEVPPRRPGEITSVAYKEGVSCLRVPPAQDADLLFQASTRLLEAGASLYGLLATPDGGLLVARGETADSEKVLRDLGASGLSVQRGWAAVALVGEGLREAPGRALSLLDALADEPIAAILAGDTGVSLVFLVPDNRLSHLIPKLHEHCIEKPLRGDA